MLELKKVNNKTIGEKIFFELFSSKILSSSLYRTETTYSSNYLLKRWRQNTAEITTIHITLPVMMYRKRIRILRKPIHINRPWSSLKMYTMLMSENYVCSFPRRRLASYLTKKVTPEGACRATKGTRRDLSTVVPAASINLLRHNNKKNNIPLFISKRRTSCKQ